jgi:FAD/FMN-containing dehydrogenase
VFSDQSEVVVNSFVRPEITQELILALESIVGSKQVFTDARVIETFSRDQYGFSPVLEKILSEKRADVIVAPGSSEELVKIIHLAAREGVPLTIRGAGSGNYGQAVPLRGGIVASMHRMNQIIEIDPTTRSARVQAGVRMGQLERAARDHGLELRMYPSTWATATLAGFIGGGFGGVGSIEHGTIWDDLVLEAEIVPMTPDAQALRINGADLFSLIHAYGTTAIMTELRIRLTDATPWEESVFSFPSLENAIGFALLIANDRNERKREVGINEWPIPTYFTPLVKAGGVREGRANVMLEVMNGRSKQLVARAATFGGTLDYLNPHEHYHRSGFALSDFTWNHTTLWAQKTDPELTYTQARFSVDGLFDQVRAIKNQFGDEVLMHLEFIREGVAHGEGQLVSASLPLVRYSSDARLFEIQSFFESVGVQIADPHTYYLDGDSRWSGEAVLNGIKRYNPLGLLNPGKLRVLETGQAGTKAGSWFKTV